MVTIEFRLVAVCTNSFELLCTRVRSILKGFLAQGFLTAVASLSDGLVSATLEVYGKVEREMLPTPSRPHYTFNLRDISKVVQASDSRLVWVQEHCSGVVIAT